MPHTDTTPRKGVPTAFYEGDTVDFTLSHGIYTPSDGWNAIFYGSGPSNIAVSGSINSEDSGSFIFTITPTVGDGLKPGIYEHQTIVTSGSEQRSIDAGRFRVRPSVKSATAGSLVSHAQKMLTLVEDAIEYRLTGKGGVDDSSVAGQSIKGMDIVQLRQLRAQYLREIHAELYGPRSLRNNINVHFLRPS